MSIYERFSVSPCELVSPETYASIIEKNKIITICNYGSGRSPEASRKLSELGYSSVFLNCGLLGLRDFPQEYLDTTISRIQAFAGIYVLLYILEANKYQDLLARIGVKTYYNNELEFISQVKNGTLKLPRN